MREIAKKFKLPVAEKKDSQGLCFVGEFKMEDFLKDYIKPKKGKILNDKGEKIGEHNGVQYYTIGQRHGFGAKGESKPLYIIKKDIKKNILIAASTSDVDAEREILIKNVNWISGKMPDTKRIYSGRIRYRQKLQKCQIKNISSSRFQVLFSKSQRGVASGQSLVLYDNRTLLGGGIIV